MKSLRLGMALSLASLLAFAVPKGEAVQLSDGTVSFNKSPHLLDAATTFNQAWVWGAKYYFTIGLPDDVGEPLQKVTIQQRQGQETIRFFLDETFAFVGTYQDKGATIPVKSVSLDEETSTITIVFTAPVPPGTTFSIGLNPIRNPEYGGIYLFGVTTFPAGEKTSGLYLGVGRLQFYRGGDGAL